MIADLLNGMAGVLLIYVAVLRQPFLHSPRGTLFEAVMGVAILALALLAMKSREAWYSRVLIPLGVALALFALLVDFVPMQLTLESWFVFWVGVLTSIVAFWGLLYPHNLQPQV